MNLWEFTKGSVLQKVCLLYRRATSVQCSHLVVSNSVIPWTAACQGSLSITNSGSLLKLTFIKSVMPFNHLILCRPLLLLSSIFPRIRVFSSESVLHIRWPKYWSFSFSISPPMNIQNWFPLELTGLISLLSKGLSIVFSNTTHSSKAPILQCSAFFRVHLSHPYKTTGKSMALTRWTFVSKVMFF